MARYTSLYQAPRSPLIQGRTRWERPLWQAWLGGVCVDAALAGGLLFALVRSAPPGESVTIVPWAIWMAGSGLVAGAGFGSLAGRSMGWRRRWMAAAILGLVGLGAVAAAIVLLALPALEVAGRLD